MLASHCGSDLASEIPLLTLIGHIARSRKTFGCVFKQLIVVLGQRVDARLVPRMTEDAVAAARSQPAHKLTYDPALTDTIAMGEIDGPSEGGAMVGVPQAVRTAVRVKLVKGG